jgi:hypothetical protein
MIEPIVTVPGNAIGATVGVLDRVGTPGVVGAAVVGAVVVGALVGAGEAFGEPPQPLTDRTKTTPARAATRVLMDGT